MSDFNIGDKVYLSREIIEEDWNCSGYSGKGGCDIYPELNTQYIISSILEDNNYIELLQMPEWVYPAHCFELANNDPIKIELDRIKKIILEDKTIIKINNHDERNTLAKLYNKLRNLNRSYEVPIRELNEDYQLCNYFLYRPNSISGKKSFYRSIDNKESNFQLYNLSDLIKPIIDKYDR